MKSLLIGLYLSSTSFIAPEYFPIDLWQQRDEPFLNLQSFKYSDQPVADTRTDVLHYTNQFRHEQGRPDLEMRDDLNAIAQKHSENMARGRTKFGHGGFAKREDQAREKIKDVTGFAENVAFGPASGEEAVEVWKKSSGHRTNMLGSYKYIGIGVASDRKGRLYYTQVFVN